MEPLLDTPLSTGCEWGDKAADKNRALTPDLASDGGVSALLPCRRHRLCSLRLLTRATLEETPDLAFPDRMMTMLRRRSTT
jgi:hypothetical protein